jgi:hypothetical protein
MKSALLLTAVLGASFSMIDATVLTVDRDHQSDVVTTTIEESDSTYTIQMIEAASLRPFCLSALVGSAGGAPTTLWSECYRAGHITKTFEDKPVFTPGADGKVISVVLTNPIKNDPAKLSVIVRASVVGSPLPKPTTPDAGPPVTKGASK